MHPPAPTEPIGRGAPTSRDGRAVGGVARIVWGLGVVAPLLVFATATQLTPDPAGHGTHMQLGLPPCGMLVATGYPCPSCGMTTAFAHLVRLDLLPAVRANAYSVPVFLAALAAMWLSVWGLATNAPVLAVFDRLKLDRVAIGFAIGLVVAWAVRIAVLAMRASGG